MHILYLDDSGSERNPGEDYVVLGGISVYEAQADFFRQELDKLAQTIDPANPSKVEFHASEIFSRRTAPWKGKQKEEAIGVIKAVLEVLAKSYDSARVFACAVHKKSFPGMDCTEIAFEDLCSRFDRYLSSLQASGDRQRGLIVLDKSAYETKIQDMVRIFQQQGTKYGYLRNLADIPFFVESRASRLIQIADHVAYAVFRRYNQHDTTYFDIIGPKIHAQDGIIHGLSHKYAQYSECLCPACLSRNNSIRRRTSTSIDYFDSSLFKQQ
jgi:hypothetical protein